MEWYIGQEIVCINAGELPGNSSSRVGILPPLVEDKIYVVSEIRPCKCGRIQLDVGLRSGVTNTSCICGEMGETSVIHWASDQRFVPLDEWSAMDSLVTELIQPQEELV